MSFGGPRWPATKQPGHPSPILSSQKPAAAQSTHAFDWSDIRNVNLGQSTAQKPPPLGGGGRSGDPAGSPSEQGPIARRTPGGEQKETPKQGQPANQSTEVPSKRPSVTPRT